MQTMVVDALPGFGLPASGLPMTVLRWLARSRQVLHALPAGGPQHDLGIGRFALPVRVVEPRSPPQLRESLVASDPRGRLGINYGSRRDLRASLETGLVVCLAME